MGQAFKQGIPGAYEALREEDILHYIADKAVSIQSSSNYCTVILLGSQMPRQEVPGYSIDWVSWSAYPWPASSTHHLLQLCKHYLRWQPATSYLILPGFIHLNHHEWDGILRTLKSYTGKNSIMSSSEDDREHLKQDMKETVRILDECLRWQGIPALALIMYVDINPPIHGQLNTFL